MAPIPSFAKLDSIPETTSLGSGTWGITFLAKTIFAFPSFATIFLDTFLPKNSAMVGTFSLMASFAKFLAGSTPKTRHPFSWKRFKKAFYVDIL